MPREIERKFLMDLQRCPLPASGQSIRQGYIPTATKTAVRVRIAGDSAFLTIKGESRGAVRQEFEYPIPPEEAEQMLDSLCDGGLIEKTRYLIDHVGHRWEVDVFEGDNRGLCIAEVELESEDEQVALPDWVSDEVTGDPRYYNASLVEHPYRDW